MVWRQGPAGRRQRFAAHFVLPASLGPTWRRRHPEVSTTRPALRALRQWLRIHPLAPDRLGNPSAVVDELWGLLARDRDAWAAYEAGAYPRAWRGADVSVLRREARRRGDEGVALAWALSSAAEGVPRWRTAVPALLAADGACGVPGATHWVASCGNDPCHPPEGIRCVHHQLAPLVPANVPEVLSFRPPPRAPGIDWSEHRFSMDGTFSSDGAG